MFGVLLRHFPLIVLVPIVMFVPCIIGTSADTLSSSFPLRRQQIIEHRHLRRHLPSTNGDVVFPFLGAVFLPDDAEIERISGKNEMTERHLATITSVMPGRAAWAALEAVQWTNGTGLDVAFGPACDYVLATVTRILSFYRVPIFTNAGFSEFFIEQKSTVLLTRVGPLQDHISELLERLFRQFGWLRSRMFYEKQFWETELHEAGFCKLLMNGLYARTVTKRWGLEMSASIVPSSRGPHWARQDLVDLVGVNNGGQLNM
ncbi:hypothetical protein niasHT_008831 [Heterodera trifolii]|uniref:Receptor ligand binding region domain-containing protein n=1 Tax=Heterodera trifolii TaxID=157864 RepID=A0ABD2LUQ8_9BILA